MAEQASSGEGAVVKNVFGDMGGRRAGFQKFGGDAEGIRGDILKTERAGVGDDAGKKAGRDVGRDGNGQGLQQGVDDLGGGGRAGVQNANIAKRACRDMMVNVHDGLRAADNRLDMFADTGKFAAVHDEGQVKGRGVGSLAEQVPFPAESAGYPARRLRRGR